MRFYGLEESLDAIMSYPNISPILAQCLPMIGADTSLTETIQNCSWNHIVYRQMCTQISAFEYEPEGIMTNC